jgi:uncharacterized membrane protein YbaN (DUF454 family)
VFNPLKNIKIKVNTSNNKIIKIMYLSFGIFFIVIGTLGLIIPIMPGFIFIIPGIYCLAKASNRLHTWMRGHRHIGKYFHKHDS